jgi:hypothetical protein
MIQATIERIDHVHNESNDNSEIVNKNFEVLETFLDKRLDIIEDIFKMVNEEFINVDKKMEHEINSVEEKLFGYEENTLQFVEKIAEEFVNTEQRFENKINEMNNKIQKIFDIIESNDKRINERITSLNQFTINIIKSNDTKVNEKIESLDKLIAKVKLEMFLQKNDNFLVYKLENESENK